MRKLKPRRYVIIGDTTYYHGDYITACIGIDNEEESSSEIENARICINEKSEDQEGQRHFHFWICQDEREGCSNAHTTFEFQYSWTVRLNKDGDITSEDAEWVRLERRCEPDGTLEVDEKDIQVVEQEEEDLIDDDPMPEDWTPSEKDMQFLRN